MTSRLQWLAIAAVALSLAACADEATRLQRAKDSLKEADYRTATIELKNILQANPDNAEARAVLGEIALRNGDTGAAIKELRRARESGAPGEIYAVNLARAYLREGRYQETLSLSPDMLSDPGQKAALTAAIGTARLEQGDQQAAERDFAAALALDAGQATALIGKARLAQLNGDMAAARSSLEQMLEADENNHEGLAAMARLQHQAGEYELAEQSFRKALESIAGTRLAHERLIYMSGLMETLLAQNKATEAQALGANMIKMTAEHPVALLQAGRADFAAGNYDDAIEKAERIVVALPTAEPPRMLLAASAIAQGNRTLAATHLQAAVNINPQNNRARKLLAEVRMQLGDPEEALAVLEPAMAAGTTDAQILSMAGTASIRSGDVQAGVELVERGIEAGTDDANFALRAAADFLAAGEIDRAIEVLEGLPEAERVSQRELLLVLALTRKGETDKARAMVQEIVDANPDSAQSYRLKAGLHLALGETDQARAALEQAVTVDPDELPAILSLARLDVREGRPQAAEERFQGLLARNPGNLVALTGLAELAERRGALEEGVGLLEQAREANPDALQPLLLLGRYYLRAGQLDVAKERADLAVRVAPANAQAHVLLGSVLLRDKRHSEALPSLERAVEINSELADAHLLLGQAQIASGRSEAGYSSLKRAAELSESDHRPMAALVAAEMERGDYKSALANVDRLIEQLPDRVEPLILKAGVEAGRQDFAAALQLYEQAAAMRPSLELAARRFALASRLERPEPWRVLEEWVNDNPGDVKGREMLARAYITAGMMDKAIDGYEQLMTDSPSADIAATLAIAHVESGDLDAAASWLNEGIRMDPDKMSTRVALANVELQRGNTSAAAKLADEIIKDFPGEAAAQLLQGEVLLAQGDYSASIAALDTAAAMNPSTRIVMRQYEAHRKAGREDGWQILRDWSDKHPDDIRVALTLAQEYSQRDWNDESVDAYRRVLDADPDNIIALNNIAWAYNERGEEEDKQRALNAATRAYEQRSDMPAIADTYGWILLQNGKGAEALEILQTAAAADTDPEISYHLAVALDDQGRTAEAARVLDRILAADASFASRGDAETLRRRLKP